MLQIQKIRTDKDSIIKNILEVRKVDVSDQINKIYNLDKKIFSLNIFTPLNNYIN